MNSFYSAKASYLFSNGSLSSACKDANIFHILKIASPVLNKATKACPSFFLFAAKLFQVSFISHV